MKKIMCLVLAALLLTAAAACQKKQPAEPAPAVTEQPAAAETQAPAAETEVPAAAVMTAYRADGTAVTLEDCGDGTWKTADGLVYYPGEDGILRSRGAEDLYTEIPAGTPEPAEAVKRQDGERFARTIILEGMEETVQYEHIRTDTAGFEMDYEYESLVRQSGPDREIFVSVYDDPDHPENYLEVEFTSLDAETVAASVIEALSDEYEISRDSRTLERAGSCIRIEASEVKGGGVMADRLQVVYIIPAPDGCRVATEHFAIEAAEGFGRRFSYMINTIEVIGRDTGVTDTSVSESWSGADHGELPEGWTGADFGEMTQEEMDGWTAADHDELPEGWTGADFGEMTEAEMNGWTGADFGEMTEEELNG